MIFEVFAEGIVLLALALVILLWETVSIRGDYEASRVGWYRVCALYSGVWVIYWVRLAFLRDMDLACNTLEFPVRGSWRDESTEVDIETPEGYFVISRGRYYGRGSYARFRRGL